MKRMENSNQKRKSHKLKMKRVKTKNEKWSCSSRAFAVHKWGSWSCGCQLCACVVDDCHECVLLVSLDDHFGMSDVSCECGQTATCEWISVTLFFKSDGNHLLIQFIYGCQNCDDWRVFLCLQEAVVALDNGCAWLGLWSWLMSVFSPTSSDADVAPRLIW